jgi:hypothetical protein
MVQWLHPVEGTVTAGKPVKGGAMRAFEAPFRGKAVLYLGSHKLQSQGE